MAVVGVVASSDDEHHLPHARRIKRRGVVLGVGDEAVVDATAYVGQRPTCSTITAEDDRLILKRGPSWTAPIYYRVRPHVAASSSLAALHRADDTVDAPRLAAMTGYAVQRGEARTVYREIKLVKPFETVVLTRDGATSRQGEPPPVDQLPEGSVEDLASELRRLLMRAVEKAIGDRRVAVMLSGGLDSSSVLGCLLAVRGASPRDVAVTLDFDAPGSDRPHVQTLERHFGINVVRVSPKDAPALETLVIDAAPSRHHGDPWTLACARRAREMGAEVLVTGTAGDGYFGGDLGTAVRSAVLGLDLAGAWQAAKTRFPHRLSPRHRMRVIAAGLLRPFVPHAVRKLRGDTHVRGVPPWVGPVLRDELTRALRQAAERRLSARAEARFIDAVLNPADSEYGAEARAQTDSLGPIPRADPIYDLDLVRFLTTVRHQALFAGSSYRGLLRRAMRGLLPDSVRLRVDKSDFEPALAAAVRFSEIEPLLDFRELDRAGIIRAGEFNRYLAPLYATPADGASAAQWVSFWPALCAEAFLRRRP